MKRFTGQYDTNEEKINEGTIIGSIRQPGEAKVIWNNELGCWSINDPELAPKFRLALCKDFGIVKDRSEEVEFSD